MHPFHPDHEETEDEWQEHSDSERQSGELRSPNRVVQYACKIWNPIPIPKPEIAHDLDQMSWPERTSEVIRFAILGLEHWLSQGGLLREWIRLNLWAAVILTTIALLVIPPVTTVLEGAVEWSILGNAIVINITDAILKLPPIAISLATLFLLVKFIQRLWMKRHREQQRHQDDLGGYR